MKLRVAMSVAGVAMLLLALPAARYLAAEAWSPGAVGFGVLLALPGLALLAQATAVVAPLHLAPALPLAVMLLGLDVTDSAREGVVAVGYGLAAVSLLAAVGSVLALRRRGAATA